MREVECLKSYYNLLAEKQQGGGNIRTTTEKGRARLVS